MKIKLLTAAAGAAALFMISPAFAQSTADVSITSILRVQDGCAINGGVNLAVLDFGTIVNAAARTDDVRAISSLSGGPIIVSCNVSSTTATFQINAGNNDAGGVHRLRNIPGTIIQGRYDMVCPVISADDLHRAWPEAEYIVIPDAGHSAWEPGIRAQLVGVMEKIKARGLRIGD